MTAPEKIDVTLRCPKCGQFMTFSVVKGDDATAVCDRCQVVMVKSADIVRTEHEESLSERVSVVEMEVSALKEDVVKLEKAIVGVNNLTLTIFDRTDVLLDEIRRLWSVKKALFKHRKDRPYKGWPDRLKKTLEDLPTWLKRESG